MPEGDTIWRAATELQRRLRGRRVSAARPAALTRLVGRTLLRVEPIGKHLYMHFSDGVVLHTHMRMTGAWHVYETGERRRRAAHLTTAALDFGGVQAILFAAPTCELVSAAAVGSGLGPDILAADLDVAEVVALVRATSHRTIAELMLDQRVCAGVGNIFRCDALWHERVDPMASPSAFDDAALARIYGRARDLMRRAAISDGFRSRQAVHGRAGRPCTSCGTLIRSRALGRPSRILFWCPRCQGSDGRQHPVRDHDPLQQGSGEHQGVEDLVEAERVRPRVGALERVDDSAANVYGPAERE
jgi:endonuclease-8